MAEARATRADALLQRLERPGLFYSYLRREEVESRWDGTLPGFLPLECLLPQLRKPVLLEELSFAAARPDPSHGSPAGLRAAVERLGPWEHSLELTGGVGTDPDGRIPEAERRFHRYRSKLVAGTVCDLLGDELVESSILELGCGFGLLALELAHRGAKSVLAVDECRRRVEQGSFLRELYGLERVRFACALPADLGRPDVVLLDLERLSRPASLLAAAAGAARLLVVADSPCEPDPIAAWLVPGRDEGAATDEEDAPAPSRPTYRGLIESLRDVGLREPFEVVGECSEDVGAYASYGRRCVVGFPPRPVRRWPRAAESSPAWTAEDLSDDWLRTHLVDAAGTVCDRLGAHVALDASTLLDFGCGDGITALGVALRSRPRRLIGADVTRAFAHLRRLTVELSLPRLPSNLSFVQVEAGGELDLPAPVDALYSWSTFEHVERALLPRVARLLFESLRPGGVAFVQVEPLYYSPYGSHLRRVLDEPWAHLRLGRDELERRVRGFRGEVVEVERDLAARESEAEVFAGWLWEQYRALNQLRAQELEELLRSGGFELLESERSRVPLEPPAELLERFAREDLVTHEVRILARRPASEARGEPQAQRAARRSRAEAGSRKTAGEVER